MGAVSPLFQKALQASRSAHKLLADEDYDGACDRAYYAMFHTARALLELEGEVAAADAKRHGSVLRSFSEAFVVSGRASRDLGRDLNFVQGLRAKADYARVFNSRADAEAAVAAMSAMLQFAVGHFEGSEQ